MTRPDGPPDETLSAAGPAADAVPPGGEAVPSEGEAAPPGDEAVPLGDEAAPSEDEAVPLGDEEVGAAVAELAEADLEPARRRRLLGRLMVRAGRRGMLSRPAAALRWITDTVTDIAPHVPIRDLATLRVHHGGLAGEELADRLIRNAARATASVGAAGGGIAAVEWVATPTLLTAPVLLAAETVAVVAIELKLVGELHEVYQVTVPGGTGQRSVALIQSWAQQRGVNPFVPGVGAAAVLGTAARKELRERLLRRFGRNLSTLGPLLTGAAVAGYLNSRATRSLGDRVRTDLRRATRALDQA